MQYVAVNLVGSSLLLVGISLLYGVTGTLSMAELAVRIPALAGEERALVETGAAVLGVAFLVKAGAWPLSFWLPGTYAAASAPVAAVFAIMTKVGVYAILRLSMLFFPGDPVIGGRFGEGWLLVVGLLTVGYGMTGALASRTMARLAGYCAIISSGTLIAILGTGNAAAVGGALFYLVASTLGVSALFLLVELVERERDPTRDDEYLPVLETSGEEDEMEAGEEEIGIAIPGMLAVLGVALVATTLVLAGMPPFPGFVGKVAMLHSLLDPAHYGDLTSVPGSTWVVMAVLIISGLAVLVALTRVGINEIWARSEEEVPPIRATDFGAVVFLLLICFGLTVQGGPVMRYMDDTARSLQTREVYIDNVLVPAEIESPLEVGP